MISCLICNSQTSFFLKKDGHDFQKCPACGLVFVHPQPNEEYIAHEVYSEKSGYQKHKKKDLSTVKENFHIKKILSYLEKQFPRQLRAVPRSEPRSATGVESASSPRLLDVGCSNGEFLFFAKQRGFETYGVELNKLTAEIAIANGLNVKIGTLENAQYADNFFDVIFLGDIIEHMPSPLALLAECRRILKSNGTLVISTPNLDSFWAQATFKLYTWFKIPWSALTPPHHLFQFSEQNLKLFLKENGFAPTATWYRRPPRLKYELGSLHLWGRFKREKTLKNLFFMLFAFAVYTKLYIFDLLITLFKKKDFGMIVACKKF
ncbi:MAG: methyltransferase domain-containing protein [bacterium]|nr:methyltransferase domain-containing protein [bacterium]